MSSSFKNIGQEDDCCGIPSGVNFNNANKVFFTPTSDGLIIRANDSATQTNAAGGFNGSGTGNAGFVSISGLDTLNFNTFDQLSFQARVDFVGTDTYFGQTAWNILANFNNGSLPLATDFVNLVWDNNPTTSYGYFPLTSSFQTFTLDADSNGVKAVGGTGSISVTGNVTLGSPTVTNISNVAALTVGMYFKELPADNSGTPDAGKAFVDGTTIISLNPAGSSIVVSTNSLRTATGASFRQYGGIPPVDRTGTLTSGNATITDIANTTDLQVNMAVSGTGIPSNTRIISMVANTSITLSANATANGSQTLSFVASGLTGIPSNADDTSVSFARIAANNPNGYFAKTTPITPTWTTADGGFGKNVEYSAFNFKLGSSGTSSRAPKQVTLKNITLNGIDYTFGE